MLNLRLYRQRILVSMTVCCLCACMLSLVAIQGSLGDVLLNQLQAFYFMSDMTNVLAVILQLIPFTLFIICFIDLFRKDLQIEIIYCFTRERNLKRWFLKKLFLLSLFSFLMILFFRLLGIIFLQISSPTGIDAISGTVLPNFYTVILAWLFVFTVSLLMNMLSFYVPVKWLLPALVLLFFMLGLHFVYARNTKLQWLLNPIFHFYFKAHIEYLDYVSPADAGFTMPNFMVWQSVLFFFVVIMIISVIGYWRIKKIDFGLLLED